MSGASFWEVLTVLIWGGWLVTMLWGSILALGGDRNWATIFLVTGSGGMLAGLGSLALVVFGDVTPSSMSGDGMMVVMMVGSIMLLMGMFLFAAGFVGLGAQYGAMTRRAEELEGLLGQLQGRLQSGL
jgi:hypothetical protein